MNFTQIVHSHLAVHAHRNKNEEKMKKCDRMFGCLPYFSVLCMSEVSWVSFVWCLDAVPYW